MSLSRLSSGQWGRATFAFLFWLIAGFATRAQSIPAPQEVHALRQQLANYAHQQQMTGFLVLSVLLFAMAAACIILWWNARNFTIFRTTGALLLAVSAVFFVDYIGLASRWQWLPETFGSAAFLELTAESVRVSKRGWIWPVRLVWAAVLAAGLFAGLDPSRLDRLGKLTIDLSQALVLILVVIGFARGSARDRILAAVMAILWFDKMALIPQFRSLTHIPKSFTVGGWTWNWGPCVMVVIGAVILAIFARELLQDQREKQRLAGELAAGRAVQQALLGTAIPAVPGLHIESVYRPAGEVGGDFFQVLPRQDGGVLVAVGDVSGKGLSAAMTVSAITGALTILADRCPAEILRTLNRSLRGRMSGGFVTCCVAHISTSGRVTVANAGHPMPYRNGEELSLPTGVPLGISAEEEYIESSFALESGGRLTLLTDGVVEARSAAGELFGFERTSALSGKTAQEIATAAEQFGQEDDITVLTVAFSPLAAGAA